jgi:PAS domain S-box-containing protein
MWSILRSFVSAPTFADKERTHAARWLNRLALTLISLLSADSILVLLGILDEDAMGQIMLANSLGLAVNLLALLLMRRGQVRLAGLLLVGVLFALITYGNAFIFRSIRTPNILTYFALIPLTGLVLGRRPMNLLAGLSIVTIVAIFALEWTGTITPVPITRSLTDDLVVLLLTIAMNTLLLNASIRRVQENAEEVQRAAEAVAVANQELQLSQRELQQARAELEQRVEQRTRELQQSNTQLQVEIEERRQLMEALRQSEGHWRSLAEYLPEIIVTITLDRTIAFLNQPIGQRRPDTLIGAPVVTIHTRAEDQALLLQGIEEVLLTGETFSYESVESREQGTAWYLNRVGAIRQDGAVTALILISTDITEQKQTERLMAQSQKLESLGVLAGGVAHDFNNLLTAMMMQLSLATAKLPAEHPVRRHLERTMTAAERAAELTRQMLNYAGRSPSEIKMLDLNDLIMDNVQLFSATIPKTIQLQSHLSSSIPLIMGDRGQIQQLIMNLILNSAEAIGDKPGTIRLKTDVQELTGEETQYWHWSGTRPEPGRYVRLEVQDTGIGMDTKTLSKIFDPFFTTKFTGRGLGLASVLGIVRSHKGGLSVSSTLGHGTTFSIFFPALTSASPLVDETASLLPAAMAGALALIIDDEELVREALANILSEAGLQVLHAADGPSGIELFRARHEAIDVVLLDLSMPGMNGEQVFYALQAIDATVPVLIISGYSEQEVMDRFVNKRLAGFIQKPFSVDSLLQKIRPHLQSAMT